VGNLMPTFVALNQQAIILSFLEMGMLIIT
jgi:hypothetical protein